MRAWDHFILVNTFAKAYNPETAATDGIAIVSEYDWKRLLPKLLLPKSMTLSSRISRMRYFICRKNRWTYIIRRKHSAMHWHGFTCSTVTGKRLRMRRRNLKRNNALIDYIALDAVGEWKLRFQLMPCCGNPKVLNYAYMGSYSENPSIAYGMISPELVQLFGDNDERMNLF